MQSLVGDTFLKKKILEKEVEYNDKFEAAGEEELENIKILALYFSAATWPFSLVFTRKLKEFYNKINLDEKFMEIVYVSIDQDEEQFKKNYALMPWIALKFGDSHIKALRDKYKVISIPYLVVLDPLNEWNVISIRGRKEVQDQPDDWFDLWLSRQQDKKYMAAVPNTPVSVTITDEAVEAMKVYKEWEEERKREKEKEEQKEA